MIYDLRIKKIISSLPKSPGVYEFRDKQGKILYIGKATSLRDRVGSYFLKNANLDRPNIVPMVLQIADIKIHEIDSVLEALILESNLIKKHQPKYNVMAKDDKSFGYFVITKEKFPRVIILWKTELGKIPAKKIYGPYLSKYQMNIALKLIRRIFPFHSNKQQTEKGCLDFQIGKCPGPHSGAISQKDYLKNIQGIEMILQGKKKNLLIEIKKQMKLSAKKDEFEKAAEARNRIFALEHIRDVALIANDENFQFPISNFQKMRIEGYDISNIAGDYAVGSMVVFSGNKPDKSQYRKFKIKTISGIDDVGMMREVLYRRFNNNWPKPDLMILDGGKGHLNMAQKVIGDLKLGIPIIAVAKGPTRKRLDLYQSKFLLTFLGKNEELRKNYSNVLSDIRLLEHIRNEAHRFAISYHKKLRKNWKER
ncbi:MAG TPA: GIY-YIG nuclease family protein [Candidatus Saccharimonadales bacterium]|nr:GIY-YIG nuclease family protein [Candidatus Saccharimonadales bacterium]